MRPTNLGVGPTASSSLHKPRPARQVTTMQTLSTPTRFVPESGLLALSMLVVAMTWALAFVDERAGLIVGTLIPASLAAICDARIARLPNRLVVMTALPAVLLVIIDVGRGQTEALGYVVGGSIVMTLPILMIHLVSPSAMGFGDVKLAAALGLPLGATDPRLSVGALFIASAVTGVAALVTRRASLPLGPGLVVGTAIAWAIGRWIGMELAPWR